MFDTLGRPWLKFGKLLRGHTSRLLVNVRNNGVLPVNARLEMEQHDAFRILEGPQVCVKGKALLCKAPNTPPLCHGSSRACEFHHLPSRVLLWFSDDGPAVALCVFAPK